MSTLENSLRRHPQQLQPQLPGRPPRPLSVLPFLPHPQPIPAKITSTSRAPRFPRCPRRLSKAPLLPLPSAQARSPSRSFLPFLRCCRKKRNRSADRISPHAARNPRLLRRLHNLQLKHRVRSKAPRFPFNLLFSNRPLPLTVKHSRKPRTPSFRRFPRRRFRNRLRARSGRIRWSWVGLDWQSRLESALPFT